LLLLLLLLLWWRQEVDSFPEIVAPALGDTKHGIVAVSCGAWHTLALTTLGDVFSFGWGRFGQLVRWHCVVLHLHTISSLRVTTSLVVAVPRSLTSTMSVYLRQGHDYDVAPALDCHGMTALVDSCREDWPRLVEALEDESIVSISAGAKHSVALSAAGTVFLWGYRCSPTPHAAPPAGAPIGGAGAASAPGAGSAGSVGSAGGGGGGAVACGGGVGGPNHGTIDVLAHTLEDCTPIPKRLCLSQQLARGRVERLCAGYELTVLTMHGVV
jgi:hypothetical protein